MESMNILSFKDENNDSEKKNKKEENNVKGLLSWWYRLAAPPEAQAGANLYERERVRRGKVGSLSVAVLILFLLAILAQNFISNPHPVIIADAIVGLLVSGVVLYLNRKGHVELAGIVMLLQIVVGGTLFQSNYPEGLSLANLSGLYSNIILEMVALAFFSANSLLIMLGISMLQAWIIVVYGPHDAAIAHLLQTAPLKIFFPVYVLQLVTTATLYFWARSTENALKRADRAEEIVALEKREQEKQEEILKQKRQLDAGIQEILQTHVAVANGDFNARAPLRQDHVLWQVAVALNNLIGRLQSLSQSERELRHQLAMKDERWTDQPRVVKLDTQKVLRAKTY